MDGTTLYILCVLGALGLYLLLRRGRAWVKGLGVLLAIAVFAGLLAEITRALGRADAPPAGVFFVLFSLIALASALRMITHHRPVYSALYFVLVVLSSAGLFLLLEAEFMAFALIIIYAGAILITYLFVLMLAQQAPDPNDPSGLPEYDRYAREPAAAAIVAFVMLALFSHMIIDGLAPPTGASPADRAIRQREMWRELEQMPVQLESYIAEAEDEMFILGWPETDGLLVFETPDEPPAVRYALAESGEQKLLPLDESQAPENIQRVGLALILTFREGQLELAGVILLMAMLGAVVLARKQIELTEEEKREAAGFRRLGHEDETPPETAAEGGRT